MDSLTKQRSYPAIVGNEIITKSRYTLSFQQNKILLFIISKVQPTDEPGTYYTIEISDFLQASNQQQSGNYYIQFKNEIKKIADTSVWLEISPGNEILLRWLDDIIINRNSGKVTVSFHHSVAPYIFSLQDHYTRLNLYDVFCLHHKYSIRVYEIMAAFKNIGELKISVEELKKRTDSSDYTQFGHFKARVLEPSIEDINKNTGLHVEYELIKKGRKIDKIHFWIEDKKGVDSTKARITQSQHLNKPKAKRPPKTQSASDTTQKADIEKQETIAGTPEWKTQRIETEKMRRELLDKMLEFIKIVQERPSDVDFFDFSDKIASITKLSFEISGIERLNDSKVILPRAQMRIIEKYNATIKDIEENIEKIRNHLQTDSKGNIIPDNP